MLEEILSRLNNWFEMDYRHGTFSIQRGQLVLPDMQPGQYFRIRGSVFNDGLHQYPANDLTDETFTGCVSALAVPKALVSLAREVEEWKEKYGEASESPFASESYFGEYSYTKSARSNGSVGVSDWADAFRGRMAQWRKI